MRVVLFWIQIQKYQRFLGKFPLWCQCLRSHWRSCLSDSAVVQGAFLLANKLCLPSSLSSFEKADWSRVGHPVLAAVREICGEDDLSSPHNSRLNDWKKKLVCVVWLKSCREVGGDDESAWRDCPFFPLLNALPEVNRAFLLELVKSMSAVEAFAHFLRSLPGSHLSSELLRLTEHVKISPVSAADVRFFLKVWWSLWKGNGEQQGTGDKSMEAMFAEQFAAFAADSTSQAAKRLKLDPSVMSSAHADVLDVLLHALDDLKAHVSTSELCFQALAICLDALYTSFLIEQPRVLPAKEKIHVLSRAVSVGQGDQPSAAAIQEAQRDLRASHTPAPFQPSRMKLAEALAIVAELAQFWKKSGLLEVCDGSYASFRLQQSVHRFLAAVEEACVCEVQTNKLRASLESLSFPAVETTAEVKASVAMTIVGQRLDDYQEFALLLAGESSWAAADERWIGCLETNRAAFQQLDTLMALASTVGGELHAERWSVSQHRKLLKLVTDVFSALPSEDKNRAVAAMLERSSRGFFGCSSPSAATAGFEQELNMALNCIIQGGRGAAAPQGSLNTAVSLIARVAFQNPEATLTSCCHSAVFNKGSSALMAQILQQLPGLRGPGARGPSLLCR